MRSRRKSLVEAVDEEVGEILVREDVEKGVPSLQLFGACEHGGHSFTGAWTGAII
jgi:hypothetical protein